MGMNKTSLGNTEQGGLSIFHVCFGEQLLVKLGHTVPKKLKTHTGPGPRSVLH